MCTSCFGVMILLEFIFFVLPFNINDGKRITNLNDCVVDIGGTEINLNILNKAGGYELNSENNTYILNICGPALMCQHHDASACIVNEKKEIKVIGLYSKINLNHSKLKYKFDSKVETQIEFKCNRHLKSPYIQYISRSTGKIRKHKFIFQTSLICVKVPSTCQIYDAENNEDYDINSLYNANSNWLVKNVSNEVKIYLNICEELVFNLEEKNTDCGYKGTQICRVDRFGNETNLGVFPTVLKPSENGLSINFTGGSLCRNDMSSIVTKLNLICSFNDSGPILSFTSECEYSIVWFTPAACPYYSSVNEDCILNNAIHEHQKEPVYLSRDKEHQISRSLKIKYNICGALSDSCHGHKNVSICLINNNEEIIFGTINKTLISKDATVYINLIGELCRNYKKQCSVKIQFRCDYTPDKQEEISISKDLCSANVTVFTAKVCGQADRPVINCKIPLNDSHHYDLTPLISENHNYEVTDPNDPSQVYLLNVCLPVIFDTNCLCTAGSIICLRNNAEPNKYKRFKSLGNYMESSGLRIQNDKLFVEYESGVCPGVSRVNYKSIVKFECAHQNPLSEIELLSKTDCEYTFIWKTQFACPIAQKNQVVSDLTNASIKENNEKIANRSIENLNGNSEMQESKIKELMHNDAHLYSTIENETINNVNRTVPISMYVPIEIPGSSGIFINNCTLRNKLNKFDMYGLPRETYALSKSGKIYSVNICHQPEEGICTSMKCLTIRHIAVHKQFIVVNFTGHTKCNDRSYNSVIFFKCSAKFENPEVIQEQECSVQLEWKNQVACGFLKSDIKNLKARSGNAAAQIVAITIAIVLIMVIIAIAGRYYFIRKHRITDSALQLVRCEYSRVKESTKLA